MSAFSNYSESGVLEHTLRGGTFAKPDHIAVALCTDVPADSGTGGNMTEVPSGISGSSTGYSRVSLGDPASSGDAMWTYSAADFAAGSGKVTNASNISFGTALLDLGWVSGVAIVDHPSYGSGNIIYRAALTNPKRVDMGDSLTFNAGSLSIELR